MYFHTNYDPLLSSAMATTTKPRSKPRPDTDDADSPYLLIQREFEDPDDNWCYIETHEEKYCGHFLLRRVDFAPQKLSIELDRPRDNLISVTFAMAATEFAEASQVVKIISGEIEPP
jgi:hypothetical protein